MARARRSAHLLRHGLGLGLGLAAHLLRHGLAPAAARRASPPGSAFPSEACLARMVDLEKPRTSNHALHTNAMRSNRPRFVPAIDMERSHDDGRQGYRPSADFGSVDSGSRVNSNQIRVVHALGSLQTPPTATPPTAPPPPPPHHFAALIIPLARA